MGTNYYFCVDRCKHCGRSEEKLHIGKSSMGWCFGLQLLPEEGINTLGDWIERWPDGHIEDEYGEGITPKEMLWIITERKRKEIPEKSPTGYSSWEDFYQKNDCRLGPNNLLRRNVDHRCVGHGEGTYDFCVGYFS